MTRSAHLVHATRHRTRLRIPDERGNRVYFERAAGLLAEVEGVTEATGNALTASLLLHHEAPVPAETLAARGKAHALFDGIEPFAPRIRPLARASQGQAHRVDARLRALSSESLNLRTAAGVVLALAAIVQAGRGQILPNATTLLWYAVEALGVLPAERGEPPPD